MGWKTEIDKAGVRTEVFTPDEPKHKVKPAEPVPDTLPMPKEKPEPEVHDVQPDRPISEPPKGIQPGRWKDGSKDSLIR